MAELFENFLQLAVTTIGVIISFLKYGKDHKRIDLLLTCFYGCFALGALYWTLYLFLYSTTPQVFYVSEFGWISSAIFLCILQDAMAYQEERKMKCRAKWLSLVIGIPLLLLYCTYGDVLSNLIWCGIMIMLSYCSIRGLIYARGQSGERRRRQFFHISVLCFVASEYCLWTSGCFFSGKSVISPSFWSDLLLTASLIGILPAIRKAVSS